MSQRPDNKYFIISIIFHVAVILVLILGFDFAAPLVVVENTNKHDVISAVILGESKTSKILPQQIPTPPPPEKKVEPKPEPEKVKQAEKPPAAEKVIALKPPEKKKPSDIFAKDLLEDIDKLKKKAAKEKKEKQKKLQAHFQKMLRQQAEKSMRRHLLDEDIQLKSTQSHESQGVVNKYQALIQQAISEHWVIPPQTNKKLSSVLTIHLAPGGMVMDVQITKSSGDPALDRSARAAVLKASPLPVPSESADFEPFRQFTLKVKPENITDSGIAG